MQRSTQTAALLAAVFSLSARAQQTPGAPQVVISTIAGNGTAGYSGDGGPAAGAAINTPIGIVVDTSGNVYFSDDANNRIRKVTPGGTITTVAGNGTQGFSGDGGLATSAALNGPGRISLDVQGNLYIDDGGNNRVRKVTPGGIITTIAGNGQAGFSGDGGTATNAALNLPTGSASDAAGNLYIADGNNNRIRKVTPAGIITTIAGTGQATYAGDGGPAASASLSFPAGLTIDASGNLYIPDRDNQRIRKIANGVISTIIGNGHAGYMGDGGQALSAELNTPIAVALDASGNLYVADSGNNVVRYVSSNIISTIAGTGSAGYGGDGGPGIHAELNSPHGIAASAFGEYVSDTANQRIRLLTPPPSVSPGGVVPVYSPSNTIQSGEWVSIYGSNLAGTTATWNGNFPTSLGGTSVTIDGRPAFLWYVSPTQINLQVPNDANIGIVNIVVTTAVGNGSSTATLGPYAPSFSLFNGKYPAAIVVTSGPGNSGSGYDYIGPSGAFAFPSRPVNPGETLILYGVGFGPTNPPVQPGAAFSGAAPSVTMPQITIGGLSATVAFAGIVEAGLFQFNVVVPNAPSGDQVLVATVGGVSAPTGIYVSVQ